MATYYGGETLYDVISTETTVSVDEETVSLIYTVPSGYYALVKFAYIERTNNPYNGKAETTNALFSLATCGNGNTATLANGSFLNITLNSVLSGFFFVSQGWEEHKKWYSPNVNLSSFQSGNYSYSPLNHYMKAGDTIRVLRQNDGQGSNLSLRAVYELHLFKAP